MPCRDVVVAGAGPAGVATALALVRRHGVPPGRILCLDRAVFPRGKACGGGLTGHALDALDALGVRVRVPRVACHEGWLVYRARRAPVRLPRPVAVVRREEFDADLVAQARDAGVEVSEGDALAGFEVDRARGAVRVMAVSGREVSCRVLVGADGAGSLVRRALLGRAPGHRSRPLRLARAEVPAPPGRRLPMVYDFTGFDAGLRGYVWLFPVPGERVNVGVMQHPGAPLGLAALERLLVPVAAGYGIDVRGRLSAWPAWPYREDETPVAPHVLCVGDAAGIDALTGEGIAVALEHGRLAAVEIAGALRGGDYRFAGWGTSLRASVVGRELALDELLARLLYGPGDFRPPLSLVMADSGLQDLFAARVSGSCVLADRKPALLAAVGRHLFNGRERMRSLGMA